ncbi:MAG: hypothetical protein AAGG07_06810 [Planctomycetota bacterium]
MSDTGKRRRRLKRHLRLAAIAAGALLLVVLLLPTGLGLLAPGILRASLGAPGARVAASSVRLGWLGSIRVRDLTIDDATGTRLVRLNASLDTGLIGLLTSPDLGTLRISGEATVTRRVDGSIDVLEALGLSPVPSTTPAPRTVPSPDGAGEESNPSGSTGGESRPPRIPYPELRVSLPRSVELNLDGLTLSYTDESLDAGTPAIGTVVVRDLKGDATLASDGTVRTQLQALAETSVEGVNVSGPLRIEASLDGRTTNAAVTLSGDALSLDAKLVADRSGVRTSEPVMLHIGAPLVGAVLAATSPDAPLQQAPRIDVALTLGVPADEDELAIDRLVLGSTATLSETVVLTATPDGSPARATLRGFALDAQVRLEDRTASVSGSGTAALSTDGSSPTNAGAWSLSATVGVPLDDAFGFAPAIPPADIRLTADRLATAALGPFLGDLATPLAESLGPETSLVVRAQTSGARLTALDSAPAATGVARIELESAHARITAAGALTESALELVEPATISLDRPGPLLRALAIGSGLSAPDGTLRASVRSFRLPLDDGGVAFEALDVDATVTATGVQVNRPDLPATLAERVSLSATTDGGRMLTVTPEASLRIQGSARPTTLDGALALGGIGELLTGTASPTGGLTVRGLDPSIARRFIADDALPPEQIDATLAAVGRNASVALKVVPRETGLGAEVAIKAGAVAVTAVAYVDRLMGPELVTVERAGVDATVGPALADRLMTAFGVKDRAEVTLAHAATTRLELTQPVTIDLAEPGAPDKLSVQARILASATDIVLPGAEGSTRLGAVAIREATVDATVQGLGLDAPALTARASLPLETPEGPIAITAGAVVPMLSSQAIETASGRVDVGGIPTPTLDRLLDAFDIETPVALSEALGPRAGLTAVLSSGSVGSLEIRSRGVRTETPLLVTLDPDGIALLEPAGLLVNITPPVASALLGPEPSVELTAPVDARLRLGTLALGPADAPLAPDRFRVGATLSVPRLALRTRPSEGGTPTPVVVRDATLALATRPDSPGSLGARFTSTQGGEPAIDANLTISGLADERGVPTPSDVRASGVISAPSISVPLIDALAQQNGLLTDVLGPRAQLRAALNGVSASTGVVNATLTTPRASMNLAAVRTGPRAVRLTGDTDAALITITPALGDRFTEGLPVLGGVEKRTGDQPATVTTTGLTIPIGNDLSTLSGEVTLDPGILRLTTGGGPLDDVLRLSITQRRESIAGRRLAPLTVTLDRGIASYPRYTLPLGEFDVQVEGEADLPARRLDMVVWVPLGHLSDEVSGQLNLGLGRAASGVPGIGQATLVPIRVSGPYEDPKVEPDFELLFETLPERVLPDLLRGGLSDELEDLLGGIVIEGDGLEGLGEDIEQGLRDLFGPKRDKDDGG